MSKKEIITPTLLSVATMLSKTLRQAGHIRTSETYICATRRFLRAMCRRDIPLSIITPEMMLHFQYRLSADGVTRNTASFYMRNLRAVYNYAVLNYAISDTHPFRKVYTGIDHTRKRAISRNLIAELRDMDLEALPASRLWRDMFLLSFYLRGIAFVDMAYLRKSDLRDGRLTYHRRKTGQMICIGWEPCMEAIVQRYEIPDSPYLLPIIKPGTSDPRRAYRNALFIANKHLRRLGNIIGVTRLTTYVARHSWATVAQECNIPLSVISSGLGHRNEATTRIYLSQLDLSVIDKANRRVIDALL